MVEDRRAIRYSPRVSYVKEIRSEALISDFDWGHAHGCPRSDRRIRLPLLVMDLPASGLVTRQIKHIRARIPVLGEKSGVVGT